MTSWYVRDGTRAAIAALLELWRAADSVPPPTDDGESLAILLNHDSAALVVAEVHGTLAGSIIAAWDGWRGSFHRLAVRPDYRRRGLATERVRTGEDRLRARGAVRLAAIVARDEEPALGFWAARGYRFQPDHLRFTADLG